MTLSTISRFSLPRLEAVADGIFAIIITIMVLGLDVPTLPPGSSSMDLYYALGGLVPQLISYSISFYLVAKFWLSNNQQLKMCSGTSGKHIMVVFVFLFFVSFIPFTTSLVGDYSDISLAVALFHFNVVLVSIASWVVWLFVSRNKQLLSPKISASTIQYENIARLYRIFVPVLGMILCLWYPRYSYFVYFLLGIGVRMIQKRYPSAHSEGLE